jgi:hypothetical protein
MLEVIHVDHHQRDRRLAALAAAPFRSQPLVERAAIGHSGQGVRECELAQPVRVLLQKNMRTGARANDRCMHRLGDEVDRSGLEALYLVLHRVAGRDEDDRDFARRGVGFQPPAYFVAVEARHLHVEKHQVRRSPAQISTARSPSTATEMS